MQIVAAQTVNGSSADAKHLGSRQNGQLNLYVSGSLGGGALTMEAKTPDGTYVAYQTLTVGLQSFDLAPLVYRLTLAGSTAANYSAWAEDDSEFTQDLVRAR